MRSILFFSLLVITVLSVEFVSAQDTTGLSVSQRKFDRLMNKKKSVVLDVRTAEEYMSGYIGDAFNYDVMDSLNFIKTISTLDKKKKYLLYCKSGRRSGKALIIMKKMGFRRVYHLQGGITGWQKVIKKP